jgi:hypothetical protein
VYHAPQHEKASVDVVGNSDKENAQRNVVTPEPKTNPWSKKECNIDEIDDHNDVCHHSFEYVVDCEANPPSQVLPLSASSFAYSVSSNESSVSPGFGGWQTNDSSPTTTNATKPSTLQRRKAEPTTEPELTAGKTVPLLPGVTRNSYGGIRDCLPPPQILPGTPTTPPPRQTERCLTSFPFTALQLARIEASRQIALAKLREQPPPPTNSVT